MKFPTAILIAFFLSAGACAFEKDVRITKFELQSVVDAKFPMEKDVVIAKASLKYPDVYVQDGYVGMRLQYTGRFLKKAAEGQIDLHGPLVYKPDKGAFYFSQVEIVNFTINKESLSNREKLQGTIETILNQVIGEIPIHRLKQKDFKEKLAKLLLKRARVENDSLVLTLGT